MEYGDLIKMIMFFRRKMLCFCRIYQLNINFASILYNFHLITSFEKDSYDGNAPMPRQIVLLFCMRMWKRKRIV